MSARVASPGANAIVFRRDLNGVDWKAMKQALVLDDFDNGRTAEQLRDSFAASALTVVA